MTSGPPSSRSPAPCAPIAAWLASLHGSSTPPWLTASADSARPVAAGWPNGNLSWPKSTASNPNLLPLAPLIYPRCRRQKSSAPSNASWPSASSGSRPGIWPSIATAAAAHTLVSFSRVTRLLELGSALGRLACGADSHLPQPETETDTHEQAMAALKRAYGQTPASSTPGAPASAPPQNAGPAAASEPRPPHHPSSTIHHPIGSQPSTLNSQLLTRTPPPAVTSGHARRDAWGSWARQIRRLHRTQ